MYKIKILIREELDRFFNEALRDDIPDYMQKIIKKRYGDEYLDMDTPKHTDKIPSVKVEVTDENVTKLTTKKIVEYFRKNITEEFSKSFIGGLLSRRDGGESLFAKFLKKSLGGGYDNTKIDDPLGLEGLININDPNSLKILYSKEFRLPVLKQTSDLVFSENKSNIFTLYKYFLKYFNLRKLELLYHTKDADGLPYKRPYGVGDLENDKIFHGLREPILNYEKNVGDLENTKLYLYISDKPDDKLRMSISNFYSSCQNIYTGGDVGTTHNKKLLSNVFDENSKIAYLIFDSPFKDNKGNEHPYTPIARTMVRYSDGKVMFDKVYPTDMEDVLFRLIEEKTGLKNQGEEGDYYKFKKMKGLPTPYMDTYKLKNIGDKDIGEGVDALVNHLDVDVKDIEELSEYSFKVDGEEWEVYTEEEANERTRDYLLDNFYEYFYDTKIETLIDNGVMDEDTVLDIVGMSEDDLNEFGYDNIYDYLSEIGLKTLDDISKHYNLRWNYFTYTWASENVNYDNLVHYFGGEYEARSHALSSYDGEEHESGNYLLYRTN